MPDDRFIHPCLGHSDKVNQLTDLEFRVWTQYLLSADDFGVMRFSAITVQADNDSLHAKSTRIVQRCLERLIDIGLVVDFEHQQRKYLCQLNWHRYQKVAHPRHTIHPAPPREILDRCEEDTAALFFEQHPTLSCVENRYTPLPQGSNVEVTSEAPLRTAKANGQGHTANGLRERFAEFWKHYPKKVGKDAAWKAWLKRRPTQDLLLQMLAVLAWQKQQDDWLKDRGQFIPYPATWLNQGRWEDEPSQAPQMNSRTLAIARAGQEFLKS